MKEPESHSVTDLIRQLKSYDREEYHAAASRLWSRYMAHLLALARARLSPAIRRREDEHDVVQSMYASFCARQQRGDFELSDRHDLWRLLVEVTMNKARKAAVKHSRRKRDYRREDDPKTNDDNDAAPLERAADLSPTPDDVAQFDEGLRLRLETLDEPFRRLALWKLAGYTHAEIAGPEMMDCSIRAVERKVAIIRKLWERDE
jgi:hypothetical protein